MTNAKYFIIELTLFEHPLRCDEPVDPLPRQNIDYIDRVFQCDDYWVFGLLERLEQ